MRLDTFPNNAVVSGVKATECNFWDSLAGTVDTTTLLPSLEPR